jgi:hypothetical protein
MTITRSGTKGVEMVWKMGNFSTPRFENSTMQHSTMQPCMPVNQTGTQPKTPPTRAILSSTRRLFSVICNGQKHRKDLSEKTQ